MARPRGTDGARVITVIETMAIMGTGTCEDPVCEVFQYWSLDGKMLGIGLSTSDGVDIRDLIQIKPG